MITILALSLSQAAFPSSAIHLQSLRRPDRSVDRRMQRVAKQQERLGKGANKLRPDDCDLFSLEVSFVGDDEEIKFACDGTVLETFVYEGDLDKRIDSFRKELEREVAITRSGFTMRIDSDENIMVAFRSEKEDLPTVTE